MDYTKVCWYCHKHTMKPKDSYWQCSKCEATFVDLPRDGYYTDIREVKNPADGSTKLSPIRRPVAPKARVRRIVKSKVSEAQF